MAKLQHLIGMCLAGEEAPKSWYLYAATAPPKQVLDDLSQSLQQAKLPPAADVYFGANKAPPTRRASAWAGVVGFAREPQVAAFCAAMPSMPNMAQHVAKGQQPRAVLLLMRWMQSSPPQTVVRTCLSVANGVS